MLKKQKKPTLNTFMGILEKGGKYNSGYTETWLAGNGCYYVKKEGITKVFYSVNDAWRSI